MLCERSTKPFTFPINLMPHIISIDCSTALTQSFYTALLLTGAVDAAEKVVLEAINAWDCDCPATSLPRVVAIQAVKAVAKELDGKEALWLLPPELQRVARLPLLLRNCFVLRLLLGMSAQACSQLLQISTSEVHAALVRALLALTNEGVEQAKAMLA